MNDKIDWGAPIRVDGKRPEWLGDTDMCAIENAPDRWLGLDGKCSALGWSWSQEDYKPCPLSIRLPADHPHYRKSDNPLCVDTPDWAIKRAKDLTDDRAYEGIAFQAFARYIATHEEPPVDPDLIAARKLASDMMLASDKRFVTGLPDRVASGLEDDDLTVQIPLAAIKLGRELERGHLVKDER